MSLTSCIAKAGEFFHPDDKAAVIDRVRELKGQGIDSDEASRQAVQEQIDHVKGLGEQVKAAAEPKPETPKAEPSAEASAERYSAMSYEQLDAAHREAVEHNNKAEVDVVREFLGPEKAEQLSAITRVRARNKWLDENVTDEMQDRLNAVQLPEETIKGYRDAANDFDVESPESLGRSIAVISRNVDEPGFMQSPEGTTFRNALRYAKEQGWSLDKVLDGMRGRATEWAGANAPELFERIFREATGKQPKAALEAPEPGMTTERGADGMYPVRYLKEEIPPAAKTTSGPGTLNSGLNPADVLKAVRDTVGDVKDAVGGIVNSEIGREVVSSVMPMSAGSEIAQATAQRFANAMRVARFQWRRMSEFLGKEFTPEERQAMWEAGQEQNTLLTKGEETAGKGIEALSPRAQKIMGELHELGEGLWARAKAVGMVQGEGVPYWVTRMAVQIGEDGEPARLPSGEPGAFTSDVRGVTTSAPSAKQRKYLTANETEAAMRAKFGEGAQLVRDIQTMPLAMSRMAQAIAGRELIAQLKELGQVSGKDIVSDQAQPGFTTINHPAFTSYRPEFKEADGKMVPKTDADGNVLMQRTPMLISSDWAGPLKAVLSTKDGAIYSALMLAKSKAMTAIMISPAAHNMVIFGRALAYDPVAVASLQAYFKGHALAKDADLMNRAIRDGMVPIGANKGSMMDITDVARGLGKEGGWGDPKESWINLSAQKVASIFSDELGTTVKQKLDAFGDFWHHTLLWKQVGALQAYIYNDYSNHLAAAGHPPEVAGPIAANLANRYAGAVASENSSAWVRKALNLTLFSRSFNVGNIGSVHDAAMGMPSGLRALMSQAAGIDAATAGLNAARFKARLGLVTDLGMSMLMTALASTAVAKLLLNQTSDDIKNGYVRRLQAMAGTIKEHPFDPTSYNPYRLLPSFENEAGKQDRIDLGAQPGGRHEYLRLPTGKVVEDTVGWLLHAPDTFEKKLSPTARALWESVTNDKGFGVPVEDPDGNTIKHLAQGLQHILAAQVPEDSIKTLWDVSNGVGSPIDKAKLAGVATGFTVSQGNPKGPEEGAFYAQQDRIEAQKKFAMDAVKEDIKYGRDAQAYARLAAIGIPAREIFATIQNIKNPRQGMSRTQARKFIAEATPEDKASMENARRQVQE